MYNTVYMEVDLKKRIFYFTGMFGERFKNILTKEIISKKKLNKLFIKVSNSEIVIDEFFLLELYYIAKYLEDKEKFSFDINIRVMESLAKKIEEETWVGKELKNEIKHIIDYNRIKEVMNYEILKHQQIAFDRFEEMKTRLGFRGTYITAPVGAGKTFLSLAIAEGMKSNKIICIVPLPTINRVWVESITGEMYKTPQDYWSSKDNREYKNERFVLLHYEYLSKIKKMINEIKTNNITVIIDEAHNFNETKSNRSNLLVEVVNELNPENVILLSGTPIKAKATELSIMLELLDPKFNNKVKKRFLEIYKSPNYFFNKLLPIRYGKYTVKIEKNDVKLPELKTENVKIKLKNGKDYTLNTIKKEMIEYIKKRTKEIKDNMDFYKQRYDYLYSKAKDRLLMNNFPLKEIENYERDFKTIIKFYKEGKLAFIPEIVARVNKFEKDVLEPNLDPIERKEFREVKSIIKYLVLKIQGEVLGRIVGRKRIECHIDLAKNIDYVKILDSSLKKTIIFSNYIEVCEVAKETVIKYKFKPIEVYGETTKYLTQNVKLFMEVKDIDPLIATYKSLSTGVPLIVADKMICIDLPFRHHIYQQAIGRIWRLGQDSDVMIFHIELDTGNEPNINSRNIDIIEWSKEQVEMITGEKINISIRNSTIEDYPAIEDLETKINYEYLIENKDNIDVVNDW